MLMKDLRQTVISLHRKGNSGRAIGRLLKLSRNTVRSVLSQGADIPSQQKETAATELIPVVRELFARCRGNAVRVQEILKSEYDTDIAYSTLTRLIQDHGMRGPVKRAGEYHFDPGAEMQHDTSPHKIKLGDTVVTAQCASLVLAHSRYLFMQYYPCFTRFEAKTFLTSALEFMQGGARQCVVDNTSVVPAAGSGKDAVIAPEMAAFSRMFGFEFIAHRIGHADRKARVERPFHYIENNFLAGKRHGESRTKGHHTKIHYQQKNEALKQTESALRASHEILGVYIAGLKQHVRGNGARKLNRLLALKQTYPSDAFVHAVQQAARYGLYDLNRLEELIIKFVAGNYFNLNQGENDHEREH